MICILTVNEDSEIMDWIIATDTRDAWHKANSAAIGNNAGSPAFQLLEWLSPRKSVMLAIGKQVLPSGHIVLVT